MDSKLQETTSYQPAVEALSQTLAIEVDQAKYGTEGFTFIEEGRISLHLTGRETKEELLHLLLHELAHYITREPHSERWWVEASRLYRLFGVYDFAKGYETEWEELWPTTKMS